MKLRGLEDQMLRIERADGDETDATADLLLDVQVSADGYGVMDQFWVMSSAWQAFVKEFIDLEARRQGQAILESMDPSEMRLVFKAVDSLGHMAITGVMSRPTPQGFTQRLEFGFQFDPGLLHEALGQARVLFQRGSHE